MDFSSLAIFSALTRKMAWLGDRQRLLAENVANANTPNYRATDLKPLDFSGTLAAAQGHLTLASTAPGHLAGSHDAETAPAVETRDDLVLNGNTVSLEDEMIKVAQTAGDYEMAANLYRKQIGLFKAALGQGGAAL